MNVILYSTNCPKCNVLKTKLELKNVSFDLVEDEDVMIAKGFSSAPMLEVDDNIMDFISALKWINELE